VLHARAQRQLQAQAVRAQVRRQRAVAVHAGVGAAHALLGGAAVVHGEGIDVQRQPAARQHTVVRACAAEQRLDQGRQEVEQLLGACIHALAQRHTGGQQLDVQRLLEERVAAEVLDRVEVGLALHEQPDVAAKDVAGLHARAHRQRAVDLLEHRHQPLQVVAYERKAGHRRQVVGQLLDDQWAHGPRVDHAHCHSRDQRNGDSATPCNCTAMRSQRAPSG